MKDDIVANGVTIRGFGGDDASATISQVLSQISCPSFEGKIKYFPPSESDHFGFYGLADYDVAIIDTHGGVDGFNIPHFFTREIIRNEADLKFIEEQSLKNPDFPQGVGYLTEDKGRKVPFLTLRPGFIKHLKKRFKNSVVYLSACKSFGADNVFGHPLKAKGDAMAQAFIKQGAGLFVGFRNSPEVHDGATMLRDFFERLLRYPELTDSLGTTDFAYKQMLAAGRTMRTYTETCNPGPGQSTCSVPATAELMIVGQTRTAIANDGSLVGSRDKLGFLGEAHFTATPSVVPARMNPNESEMFTVKNDGCAPGTPLFHPLDREKLIANYPTTWGSDQTVASILPGIEGVFVLYGQSSPYFSSPIPPWGAVVKIPRLVNPETMIVRDEVSPQSLDVGSSDTFVFPLNLANEVPLGVDRVEIAISANARPNDVAYPPIIDASTAALARAGHITVNLTEDPSNFVSGGDGSNVHSYVHGCYGVDTSTLNMEPITVTLHNTALDRYIGVATSQWVDVISETSTPTFSQWSTRTITVKPVAKGIAGYAFEHGPDATGNCDSSDPAMSCTIPLVTVDIPYWYQGAWRLYHKKLGTITVTVLGTSYCN